MPPRRWVRTVPWLPNGPSATMHPRTRSSSVDARRPQARRTRAAVGPTVAKLRGWDSNPQPTDYSRPHAAADGTRHVVALAEPLSERFPTVACQAATGKGRSACRLGRRGSGARSPQIPSRHITPGHARSNRGHEGAVIMGAHGAVRLRDMGWSIRGRGRRHRVSSVPQCMADRGHDRGTVVEDVVGRVAFEVLADPAIEFGSNLEGYDWILGFASVGLLVGGVIGSLVSARRRRDRSHRSP